jgi:hypothetical protein
MHHKSLYFKINFFFESCKKSQDVITPPTCPPPLQFCIRYLNNVDIFVPQCSNFSKVLNIFPLASSKSNIWHGLNQSKLNDHGYETLGIPKNTSIHKISHITRTIANSHIQHQDIQLKGCKERFISHLNHCLM